jgi:NDP-sugar pyrophosphorylase family protein
MINLHDYLDPALLPERARRLAPWEMVRDAAEIVRAALAGCDGEFTVAGEIAVHRSARIEPGATLKPPCIVGPGCFLANSVYLRGGVYLAGQVTIGPAVEIKGSFILPGSAFGHLNFIGDSIVGSGVNAEAGAVFANHHNDRADKEIRVMIGGRRVPTGATRFGALIGDDCRIGANAVLSPGSLLPRGTLVPRLTLFEQRPA